MPLPLDCKSSFLSTQPVDEDENEDEGPGEDLTMGQGFFAFCKADLEEQVSDADANKCEGCRMDYPSEYLDENYQCGDCAQRTVDFDLRF